jgi:hypothetical protein
LDHLEKTIVPKLSHSQFGGQKGLSLQHLVASLIDDIAEVTDNGGFAVLASLDFSKAFNKINHNILIKDLVNYGVDGWAIRILSSYLEERKMIVRTSSAVSSPHTMSGGTPQGSLLGVILFITYLDGITKKIEQQNTLIEPLQYIDDTYLLEKVPLSKALKTEDDIKLTNLELDNVLQVVTEEARFREMKLNSLKTKIIVFKPPKTKLPIQIQVNIDDNLVDANAKQLRVLGIILEDNLNTGSHINKNLKNARMRLNFLRILKDYGVEHCDMVNLYKSMIRSTLTFGLDMLLPMIPNGFIEKLERVQKIAFKIIFGGDESYEVLLKRANIVRIKDYLNGLFDGFVTGEGVSNMVGGRLAVREREKELRKQPLLNPRQCRTTCAAKTPLNVIRNLNASWTPGRKHLKSFQKNN